MKKFLLAVCISTPSVKGIYTALFILTMFYLIMGCKHQPPVNCDSPTKEPDVARKLILGKWKWTYSRFYNRVQSIYQIWTPENRNSIKTMTFYSKGTVTIVENGKIVLDTIYSFRKLSAFSGRPADSTRYILSWKGSNTFFRICSDSMYLPFQSFGYDGLSDEVWEKL